MQGCLARYAGLVWTFARRLSANDADAEEAVQEIFLDLWKSARQFDPAHGTELGFVAFVARRRLLERRRAQGRLPTADRAALASKPSGERGEGDEASGEMTLVARALDELSDDQREVLLLSAVRGLPHEAIASATGMAVGTVKSHGRRALLRLRSLLLEPGASSITPAPGHVSPREPT